MCSTRESPCITSNLLQASEGVNLAGYTLYRTESVSANFIRLVRTLSLVKSKYSKLGITDAKLSGFIKFTLLIRR